MRLRNLKVFKVVKRVKKKINGGAQISFQGII